MKRQVWILIMLALCAVTLPLISNAETKSGTCGDKLTWTLTDSGELTISGSGAMMNYNLSSEKPWGDDVKQVVIQKGVTTIGEDAFSNCAGLTSITLPATLTSIGDWAFAESGLTEIRLPENVKSIGKYAFGWCGSLTSVTLPKSLTTIGRSAFYECGSLTNIKIPDNVTAIGDSAFWNCSSLKTVTIPDAVSGIEEYVFYGCSGLTDVTISEGVSSIGPYAFAWCSGLKSVSIPNTVKIIDKYAFSNCGSLAEITIPKKVTGIGSYAFAECRGLNGVTVKGTETEIDATAFFETGSSLTVYYLEGAKAQQFVSQNGIKGVQMEDVPVEIPVFTVQPESIALYSGETAVFKSSATDAESYRWFYRASEEEDMQPVTNNGTSATFRFVAKERYNGYQYGCMASNSAGRGYSNVVTLTVISKPVITAQPANVTVSIGETASFEVKASDPRSFQWYYQKPDETNWHKVMNNGESPVLTLTAEARHNGFKYKCKVSNKAGNAESEIGTLTVLSDIVITEQPHNASVKEGEAAVFEVKAKGAERYQWYYQKPGETEWNKVTKNGASAAYTLTTKAQHNGYQYKCVIKNEVNTLESDTVALTVLIKPVIKAQPANVTVNIGETATFEVKAADAESYQWYYQKPDEDKWNKVVRSGDSSVLTLTAEARHNGFQYKCQVKNKAGTVESDTVALTVLFDIVIAEQPINASVNVGETATFEVKAKGAESYQWYYQKPGETEWNKVTKNGNSAVYTLTVQARHNGFQYKCEMKNDEKTLESDVVTLTVAEHPAEQEQATEQEQTPEQEQAAEPEQIIEQEQPAEQEQSSEPEQTSNE